MSAVLFRRVSMQILLVSPTKRHGEFVVDLAAEISWLRELEVMRFNDDICAYAMGNFSLMNIQRPACSRYERSEGAVPASRSGATIERSVPTDDMTCAHDAFAEPLEDSRSDAACCFHAIVARLRSFRG